MESRPASAASNAAMESQTSKSEASYQSIECRSVSASSIVTIQSANSEPSDQIIECVCRSVSATWNVSIEYQSASSESTDQTSECSSTSTDSGEIIQTIESQSVGSQLNNQTLPTQLFHPSWQHMLIKPVPKIWILKKPVLLPKRDGDSPIADK